MRDAGTDRLRAWHDAFRDPPADLHRRVLRRCREIADELLPLLHRGAVSREERRCWSDLRDELAQVILLAERSGSLAKWVDQGLVEHRDAMALLAARNKFEHLLGFPAPLDPDNEPFHAVLLRVKGVHGDDLRAVEPAADAAGMPKKRKCGGQKRYSPADDARTEKRFRASGMTVAEYAEREGIGPDDLQRLLERCRYRRREQAGELRRKG